MIQLSFNMEKFGETAEDLTACPVKFLQPHFK